VGFGIHERRVLKGFFPAINPRKMSAIFNDMLSKSSKVSCEYA
jgi:hypothetical protein